MCAAKTVAIFGISCVGKTTVADGLGVALGWPVRHCSADVRAEAHRRGISPNSLSESIHHQIDGATLAAVTAGPLVVEGSFLDNVLAHVKDVLLIELTCENGERERRHTQRGSRVRLLDRDPEDDALRGRLYHAVRRPDVRIDTTGRSPAEIVLDIRTRIGSTP